MNLELRAVWYLLSESDYLLTVISDAREGVNCARSSPKFKSLVFITEYLVLLQGERKTRPLLSFLLAIKDRLECFKKLRVHFFLSLQRVEDCKGVYIGCDYLLSPLGRVVTIVYLKQTTFLGYIISPIAC